MTYANAIKKKKWVTQKLLHVYKFGFHIIFCQINVLFSSFVLNIAEISILEFVFVRLCSILDCKTIKLIFDSGEV